MESVPELQQLALLVGGQPRAAVRRLLLLLCELVGMDIGFVSTVAAGQCTVRVAVRADGEVAEGVVGMSEPLDAGWWADVAEAGSLLVTDTRGQRGALASLLGVGSYAGVALRGTDGSLIGILSAIGHAPHYQLRDRDHEVLRAIGAVAGPLLEALDQPIVPQPRRAADLSTVADLVARAGDLEQLSRPLLVALHELTGLASTYLTVIHDDEGTQELRFTNNTLAEFTLPEGLVVPWVDTLCKRALDEGRPCTTDVSAVWGDSDAARALGIQTYVSVPVTLTDGRVWGTLCGADATSMPGADGHLTTMRLFARLIAAEIERNIAVAGERARAAHARFEADTDVLTQCSSRRVAEPWLTAQLADLGGGEVVVVVFADVDDLKPVNDALGHAAGDALLVEVGRRLQSTARIGDLVVRWGGDEFLLGARVQRRYASNVADRVRGALAFSLLWQQEVLQSRCSVGFAVSDGHDAKGLVSAADRSMYAEKRR